jgi:Flp pilus assembly protein TadG
MSGDVEAAPQRERGQILVIFALALIVIIGMVGLVLDAGSVFAQRRAEQNAADLASIAGANAYMNSGGSVAARTAAAQSAAIAAATRNGYTNGVNGASVPPPTVELLQTGARVRVDITAPHGNTFARVYGQDSWDVSVTAAAVSGTIDTATGAAPWTMHIDAFNPDGTPKYDEDNPAEFNETNDDYPVSEMDIAWTDFNGGNNVNTNEVRSIIDGSNVVTETLAFGEYLGQHNNGNHTALYSDVQQYLVGDILPVPITGPGPCDPNGQVGGCFVGWAMFVVLSASGGSDKYIEGYFTGNFTQTPLAVGECPDPPDPDLPCGVITVGSFDNLVVRLVD